ncbi:hypothetical protein [Xylophilus ampelinus]|uniref:DUF3060 family protein n=1 Tax=Xylophilus ampelinus TaxID=54067 RepID=A0A318SJ28_9BURK|nr:hypothetical protein [Xylophilus ampelinus]MCS4509695.1 hypothetical protein [Xylophilus ampelinus]PYE78819.1 hypothetical protein DFQ15_10411 [Xylophilus ampelinus]
MRHIPTPSFDWRHVAGAGLALLAPLAGAGTTVIEQPGSGTNRIEVTGNRATNVQVHCADGRIAAAPTANVNSVDIDGKALEGRTIVVTGRNSQDVRLSPQDCNVPAVRGSGDVNVNGVTIR